MHNLIFLSLLGENLCIVADMIVQLMFSLLNELNFFYCFSVLLKLLESIISIVLILLILLHDN